MIDGPLGIYHPGDSWIHRARVGAKLTFLAVFSLLTALGRGWQFSVGALVAVLGLIWMSGYGLWRILRSQRILLLMLGVLIAWQSFFRPVATAVEIGLDILTLVLLATILTATTPTDQIIEVLQRVLRPLARMGVNQQACALALSLMLTAIPTLQRLVSQTKDALQARGRRAIVHRVFIPAVIRTVAHAQNTADALVARGLVD